MNITADLVLSSCYLGPCPVIIITSCSASITCTAIIIIRLFFFETIVKNSLVFSLVIILHAGHPSTVPTLSCVDVSEDVSGTVSGTLSWTLSDRNGVDSYLINITTNAPLTPYGGLLNITTGSVTQYELTGFMAGYEYSITVRGVNCVYLEGSESEPLAITPQGKFACSNTAFLHVLLYKLE